MLQSVVPFFIYSFFLYTDNSPEAQQTVACSVSQQRVNVVAVVVNAVVVAAAAVLLLLLLQLL